MTNIEEAIQNCIFEVMEIDETPEELSLEFIPNWDSITHLRLIMRLEEKFSVEIPQAVSIKMISHKIILDEIQRLLNS